MRLKLLLTITLFFLGNHFMNAAPPPPSGGTSGCWPPPCIPIDGGIAFLMAAGALYGAKKINDYRSNTKQI
jgi:hypothetical protein